MEWTAMKHKQVLIIFEMDLVGGGWLRSHAKTKTDLDLIEILGQKNKVKLNNMNESIWQANITMATFQFAVT